jgi:predicted aminopeptidase
MTGQMRAVVVLACVMVAGCESIDYYGQAAQGHWHIIRARTPINAVIASEDTPATLRKKLSLVQDARQFATQDLGLSQAEGYVDYVDIGRSSVVWNVFAAPEFDINPVTWCFPIAGCVPYRGYFSEHDANQYARTLEAQGYDVHVGGVEAYSTLGWFRDPVLSTFLARDDASLAALLFHEMSHQHLYLPGDATFNESYATAVEIEGLRRWLAGQNHRMPGTLYEERLALRNAFIELLLSHRQALQALFATSKSDDEKRLEKKALNERLADNYAAFKMKHPAAGDRFDSWFNKPVNNARLSSLATYSQWVPAFRQLLKDCNNSFRCFHKRASALAELSSDERQQELQRLQLAAGQ